MCDSMFSQDTRNRRPSSPKEGQEILRGPKWEWPLANSSAILALSSEDSRELQDFPAFILFCRRNQLRSANLGADRPGGNQSRQCAQYGPSSSGANVALHSQPRRFRPGPLGGPVRGLLPVL